MRYFCPGGSLGWGCRGATVLFRRCELSGCGVPVSDCFSRWRQSGSVIPVAVFFRIGVVWVRVPVPERSILSGVRIMSRMPSFRPEPGFYPVRVFCPGQPGVFPRHRFPCYDIPSPASFPPFLPLFSRRGSLRCRNLPGEQFPAPFHGVHIGRHAVLDPRNGRRHAQHRRPVAGVDRSV